MFVIALDGTVTDDFKYMYAAFSVISCFRQRKKLRASIIRPQLSQSSAVRKGMYFCEYTKRVRLPFFLNNNESASNTL